MCDGFGNGHWGVWHQQLTRLLIHGGEQTLNLFNQAALGDMLHPRIRQHGNIQQDAADFAGWFRAQLFDGRPDGQISTGWQKHSCTRQRTKAL